LNLRYTLSRYVVFTGSRRTVPVLMIPQGMAGDGPANAGYFRARGKTAKPLRRLGPLTDLVIERIRVSEDVAASKFGAGALLEDSAREEQVLARVRTQAAATGVDPDVAVAFFRDQITASKVVQKGLFDRWTAHPEEAPTTRPDLNRVREQLDRLTTELLQELKSTTELRGKPVACAMQLALAANSGAVLKRLDTLHRRALRAATRSVCRSSAPTVGR
jgi:chorismate mutase